MERLVAEIALRSVLIAAATAGVLKLARIRNARVCHAAWMGVTVAMLVLPLWTAFGPRATIHIVQRASTPAAVTSATRLDRTGVVKRAVVPVSAERDWRPILLSVYSLGFLVLLVRLAIGTLRARLIVRRAETRGGRLTSASCTSPVTIGFLRPAMILPEGWEEWSGERLAAVLAHEAEHVRYRDPLAQWIALLNRAVFWFHPLAWWLERRISMLAEEACDQAVIAKGHDPAEYSDSLLGFASDLRNSGRRSRVFAMAMPGQFLPRRIRKIMEGTHPENISRVRITFVAAVGAAIAVVFTVGAIGYAPIHASVMLTAESPVTTESQASPVPQSAVKPSAIPRPAPTDAEPDADRMAILQARIEQLKAALTEAQSQMKSAGYAVEMKREDLQKAIQDVKAQEQQLQAAQQAVENSHLEQLGKQLQAVKEAMKNAEVQKQLEDVARLAQDQARLFAERTGEPTVITSMTKPRYTDDARAAGITGYVILTLNVDPMGAPVDIQVTQGLGHGLDESAVEAVRQWRFASLPGSDANTQPRKVQVRFMFSPEGTVAVSSIVTQQ